MNFLNSQKLISFVLLSLTAFSLPSQAQSVSVGGGHICYLDLGKVVCWGRGAGISRPPALKSPIKTFSGPKNACAIDKEGLKCWGDEKSTINNVPPLKNPIEIAMGHNHACAIEQSGVKCWGLNTWKQLETPPLLEPKQISAGNYHSCALDKKGVTCWGRNENGQTTVPPLNNPYWVAAGDEASCALDQDGAKCWGRRLYGSNAPTPPLNKPRQIVLASSEICVLDLEGVLCWNEKSTYRVTNLIKPQELKLGNGAACAVDQEGLKCWNRYEYPPRKNTSVELFKPRDFTLGKNLCAIDHHGIKCWGIDIKVPKLKNPIRVSSADGYMCAIDDDGTKCWATDTGSLLATPPLSSPTAIHSGGGNVTCATDQVGLVCWMYREGQLDIREKVSDIVTQNASGTTLHHKNCGVTIEGLIKCARDRWSVPHFPFQEKIKEIAVSDDFTCLRSEGKVGCWGKDIEISKVPELKNPRQLVSGYGYACALDDAGVKCWGSLHGGEGDIPALKNPRKIATSFRGVCALDDDGVKCWALDNLLEIMPPLTTPLLKTSASGVSAARSEFLNALGHLEKPFRAVYRQNDFLLYLLSSPAILSADSEFALSKSIPNLRYVIKTYLETFDFRDVNNGLIKIPDSLEGRVIALTAVKAALLQALNFLNVDDQLKIRSALRLAGSAILDPQNNSSIQSLLGELQALESEKKKLTSSTKSAFLVEVLNMASTWLNKVSK